MSGWVKEHTDVLLRLSSSQRGAQSDRIGDRGVEVTDLKIEVHHRTLLAVGWWPHWGLVAVRVLKDEKDRSLGSGEDGCSWFLVTDGPPEQLRIEPGQGARVRRFDGRSPPHAVRSRSHVEVFESGHLHVKRRCADTGRAGGHRNEDRLDPATPEPPGAPNRRSPRSAHRPSVLVPKPVVRDMTSWRSSAVCVGVTHRGGRGAIGDRLHSLRCSRLADGAPYPLRPGRPDPASQWQEPRASHLR